MTGKKLSKLAKTLGRRGGQKTLKRYGVDHYKEMNRKSQEALYGRPQDKSQS